MKRLLMLLPLILLSCSEEPLAYDYELRVCSSAVTYSPIAQEMTRSRAEYGFCEPYAPLNGSLQTTKKLCDGWVKAVEDVKSLEQGFVNSPRRWRAACVYIGRPK